MKYLLIILLFVSFSCETTKDSTKSDNQKLEEHLFKILGKKVTTSIYIVHPNVCGACSNDFLIALAEGRVSKNYYLFTTGKFKEENQEYVNQLRSKIRFVDGKKLGRLGLSVMVPYVLKLKAGKVISIEDLEIDKY